MGVQLRLPCAGLLAKVWIIFMEPGREVALVVPIHRREMKSLMNFARKERVLFDF